MWHPDYLIIHSRPFFFEWFSKTITDFKWLKKFAWHVSFCKLKIVFFGNARLGICLPLLEHFPKSFPICIDGLTYCFRSQLKTNCLKRRDRRIMTEWHISFMNLVFFCTKYVTQILMKIQSFKWIIIFVICQQQCVLHITHLLFKSSFVW